MGLPITVTEKPSPISGVVRFECDRNLTGMGHERYRADTDITGPRPVDELGRRLLATGKVKAAHVYGNEVTVELVPGSATAGIADVIANLFVHYTEGVTPSYPKA